MKGRFLEPAVAIGVILVLGCAAGPDFHTPQTPSVKTYTSAPLPAETQQSPGRGGKSQSFILGEQIPGQWWQLFQSTDLDRMIRLAMADNPTIMAAQAALLQARENLRVQFGATWFPGIDANLSVVRQRTSGAAFGQAGSGTIFELYNASVSVSYMLDIFGGMRRELEALQAQVSYQDFQLRGTYLTLTANIVTSVIQEASLRAQLGATHEILADEQQAYDLIQRQFQLGGVSRADVFAQETRMAQTQATLPPLEKALSQTRHLLAVLLAKFPEEASRLPEIELGDLTLPERLPVALPSSLARQRPDIQAAEALLHAASAQVGVATANLYPRITLTGSYGAQANSPADLFRSDAVLWSLGAGLLQPLFHGGKLRAQRRVAVAALDQAAAVYRETVLQAFLNVADALRALETDARSLAAQSKVAATARNALDLTRKQFELGAVNFLLLLDAQRQYHQARISLIQAQAARFTDTAALFQALGGGWWDDIDSGDMALTTTKRQ